MEGEKQHFQHIMLYYLKKCKKATEMKKKKKDLRPVWESAVTDQMCQKGFAKFHAGGDFLLDDTSWSSRLVEDYSDQIKTLIEKIKVILCGRSPTYSNYPNQVLKIIHINLFMLNGLMFGFHTS